MRRAIGVIRGFSALTEVVVVLGLTVGVDIALYARELLRHGFSTAMHFSDRRLLRLLLFEAAALLVLGGFLWLRGWRLNQPGDRPRLAHLWRGLEVAALAYAAVIGVYFVAWRLGLTVGAAEMSVSVTATWPVILLLGLINPVCEELLYLRYLLERLRPQGPLAAIGAALLARVAVHAYQGPLALLAVLPIGVVFTWYAWRTRDWGSVVVAHALFDLAALFGRTHAA